MALAWLITALALLGVVFGTIGHARIPSAPLAAAGGGLLAGISLFGLLPEVASVLGKLLALSLLAAVAVLLWLLDRQLGHADNEPHHHRVVGPLLLATAVHSFLDGWSIRALSARALAGIAVPVGLALHKIPEGLALGWLARRSLQTTAFAILIAGSVELVTLLGAFAQPYADQSGFAAFGPSWTAIVLALVGGSFLFLGVHAILPQRRRPPILLTFFAAFLLVGLLTFLHEQ